MRVRLIGFLVVLVAAGWATTLYAANTGGNSSDVLLQQLQAEASVQVAYHAVTGKVRYIGAAPSAPVKGLKSAPAVSGEDAARSFLAVYGPLFGIRDQGSELSIMKSRAADGGRSFARFQQQYLGIPVIAGEIIVETDTNNNVLSAHGETSPDVSLSIAPEVGPDSARQSALDATARWHNVDAGQLTASVPQLSIYNPALLGHKENTNFLVWRMDVEDAERQVREFVLVDAQSGKIILHFNQRTDALFRKIYDNNNDATKGLPGNGPVRTEGQAATGIKDVDDAYNYLGDTYNYFFNNFGRNSIDGKGMQLIATVRFCDPQATCPYPNAFWNGAQMVFGATYASADDVVGHELAHGVTENEANLFYYMQSGAINESMSDIFGEFIDLTNGKGNDTAAVKWLMGEDLPIGAIRSMKNPDQYGDPDKMTSTSYVCGASDRGGVHSNSGIGNKAAYLMVDGGTFNGQTITALGIPKTAKIYYDVLTNRLTSGSDYADLATMLNQACTSLVGTAGITAANCQQVSKAVLAVEMSKQPTSCAAPEAPVCSSGSPSFIFSDNMENPASGNWTAGKVTGSDGKKYGWYNPESSNPYLYAFSYATSGTKSIWGDDIDFKAKFSLTSKSIVLPAAGTIYMHFRHAFDFDTDIFGDYDGGILEYSTNGGTTWLSAEPLFINNGYNGSISLFADNPLFGKNAFVAMSNGYTSSRLNLSSLAGKTVKFRYTIGTDTSVASWGWFLDDVSIYTCVSVTAPSNLTATSVSASRVDLAWKDNSSNETGFKIYRKAGAGAWTLLTTTAAGATSYSDATATANDTTTSYSYYVNACKGTVCSAATKTAVVPFKPLTPKATAGTGKIDVSWTDKSANETGFEVFRKPGLCAAAGAWSKIASPAANVQLYSNTGLVAGAAYSYKVRSYFRSATPYAYGYSAYTACVNATAK